MKVPRSGFSDLDGPRILMWSHGINLNLRCLIKYYVGTVDSDWELLDGTGSFAVSAN